MQASGDPVARRARFARALVAVLAAGALARGQALPFDLVDVADDPLAPDWCGVDFTWSQASTAAFSEAAGVAVADFDDDGRLDLFLPNTSPAPHALYRNLGDLQFQDVAAAKGLASFTAAAGAALFLDYDHDGDLDLFVQSHLGKATAPLGPRFKLFRNGGAAAGYSFSDVTAAAGFVLDPTPKATLWGWVAGCCAGDYDQDGWTDLFAAWNAYQISNQDQWRLLRNEPNPVPCDPLDPACTPRIFTDSTLGSGLTAEYGGDPWQPRFWDANRDGWPDLHICQDFTLDLLMLNNKNGTFTDTATAVGLNGDPPEFRNEMGSALGDVDNDLDLDLHLTNLGNKNRFYRNDSLGAALSFTDVGPATGLDKAAWGWGTTFLDVDNDGDLDHAAICDHVFPTTADPNEFRLNLFPQRLPDGLTVAWQDVGPSLPGFTHARAGDSGRGIVPADLDGDGDLDLVVTRTTGRASVYRNTLAPGNAWLQVDLVNAGGSRDVTGARAYVRHHGVTQMRQVDTGSSYLCQDPPRLHFGLGGPQPGPPGGSAAPGPGLFGTAGGVGSSPTAGSALLTSPVALPAAQDPAWLVVRWPGGGCQVVLAPARDTLHVVVRASVDDTGDLNGDGHLTATDQALLLLAVQGLPAFEAAYPGSPARITGDVDDDGDVDADDLAAWTALAPH